MSRWTLDDLSRLIDHTNLHPDATEADMIKLCDEAKRYHFKMVAINQTQSHFCAQQLAGTDIDTGAAIAFPLGQTSIAAKVFETRDALANGANEIDYVVNLTQVKEGNWDYVADEMRQIVAVCNEAGVPSKVIFENCYLTNDEKLRLCEIARAVKPTFVKTSTGFGTEGATVEDVALMFHSCLTTWVRTCSSRRQAGSVMPTPSWLWSRLARAALAARRPSPSSRRSRAAWRPRA